METVMNTTRRERTTPRLIGRASRLISLVGVALTILLTLPAAMAATVPVEQILHFIWLGPVPNERVLIESRLIFPSGAHWEVDPDAGPLKLAVESGELGVVLGGGLARIERHLSPLQPAQFHRLEPGQMASLRPGDALFVIDGYQLRVDNDDDSLAAAVVSRVIHGPLPFVAAGEYPGQPR
jgi:hypothetical protein